MSNQFKNTAFWSWNGVIREQEAVTQLADFRRRGYGGVFIHARAGLGIPYMGEEWFHVYDCCVSWAAENDFDIWIYDENGWPSGFGGGKVNGLGPEYQIKRIVTSPIPLTDEKYIPLTVYNGLYGQLYLYYVVDKNYVDLLNPDVTSEFIACVHEVYYKRYQPYFSTVIKGVFMDEPQLAVSYPWSPGLEDCYRKKYGGSLREQLWKLFLDNPERNLLLQRYYRIIAERFTEAFVRPLSHWCENHGVMLTGHFAEEDGLCVQYRANGGVMANYYEMQQPGIDFLGRRLCSPVLCKQLTSVKNQFGKETVISESFGCTGWSTTFAQMLWLWGYQAGFGINKACLHLSAYSIKGIRKRDYPAFFSYQEPWWEVFGSVSEKMEQINRFVSQGTPLADIVLLCPIESLYGLPYDDSEAKNISAQFRSTVQMLTQMHYGFDLADERLLEQFGKAEEGRLILGQASYSHLIVPECICLRPQVLELIKAFTAQGGKVLYINRYPQKIGEQLIQPSHKELFAQGYLCANRAGLLEKYFNAVGHFRHVRITDGSGTKEAENLLTHISREKDRLYIFIQNCSQTNSVYADLRVHSLGQFLEDDQVLTGTCGRENSYTKLRLAPMQNRCIVFQEGAQCVAAEERKLVQQSLLKAESACLLHPNSFNVDRAYFRVGDYTSGLIDTALIQDEIVKYCGSLDVDSCVTVVYPFQIEGTLEQLNACVEVDGIGEIKFNGHSIRGRFGSEYFVDKSILVADVTDLQQIGHNELTVVYTVAEKKTYENTLDGFETERNIFSYKSEAESIYLTGRFSVVATGRLQQENCLRIEQAEFCLKPFQKPNLCREITEQGLWFYRGNVQYRYSICCQDGCTYRLRFENLYATTVKVSTEKGETVLINPMAGADISYLLQPGENHLCVTLYGSNRNLLGPFHHRSGEPLFVGNSTFRGKKGFEDSILYRHYDQKTYDEAYHFIRFGIGEPMLETYE